MKAVAAGLFLAMTLVVSSDSLCVPGSVPAVTLYPNYTLTWMPAYNSNNCSITYYIINIVDQDNGTQFQFQTSSYTYNFNTAFLDMCTTYSFQVRALTSEAVLGPTYTYVATTAPAENMNLTVDSMNVSHVQGEMVLNWTLAVPQTHKCISYYRVVYWDERNTPQDFYVTSTNFSLKEDIPCTNYSFQVNAIIANPDLQGPITELVTEGVGEVPSVPTLVSLSTTSSSVNMVWKLEPYTQNHCYLSNLNIYTLGNPSNHSVYYLSDNIKRPNVNVTITDLSPNNVYISYVNVENNIGTSANVTITYQTTSDVGYFKYSLE